MNNHCREDVHQRSVACLTFYGNYTLFIFLIEQVYELVLFFVFLIIYYFYREKFLVEDEMRVEVSNSNILEWLTCWIWKLTNVQMYKSHTYTERILWQFLPIFTILHGNYYPPHGEFKLICIGKFARRTWVNFTQQYGKNRQRC